MIRQVPNVTSNNICRNFKIGSVRFLEVWSWSLSRQIEWAEKNPAGYGRKGWNKCWVSCFTQTAFLPWLDMTSPVLASFLVYLDLRVLSLASIKLMYVTVKQIFITTERCGSLTGYEYLAPYLCSNCAIWTCLEGVLADFQQLVEQLTLQRNI